MVGDPNIDDIANKTNISYRLKTIKTAMADLRDDLFDYTNERLFVEMKAVYVNGMTMETAAHTANKNDTLGDGDGNAYRTPLQIVQDDLRQAFEKCDAMVNSLRDSEEWDNREYDNDVDRASYACVNDSYGSDELKERWAEYIQVSKIEADSSEDEFKKQMNETGDAITKLFDDIRNYAQAQLFKHARRIAPKIKDFKEAVYQTDENDDSGQEYAITQAEKELFRLIQHHMPLTIYAIAENTNKHVQQIDIAQEASLIINEIVEDEDTAVLWEKSFEN